MFYFRYTVSGQLKVSNIVTLNKQNSNVFKSICITLNKYNGSTYNYDITKGTVSNKSKL